MRSPTNPVRFNPFERYYGESQVYFRWAADKLAAFVPAQVVVGQFLQTFKDYPPSRRSESFGVDQVLQALQRGAAGTNK